VQRTHTRRRVPNAYHKDVGAWNQSPRPQQHRTSHSRDKDTPVLGNAERTLGVHAPSPKNGVPDTRARRTHAQRTAQKHAKEKIRPPTKGRRARRPWCSQRQDDIRSRPRCGVKHGCLPKGPVASGRAMKERYTREGEIKDA